MEEEGETSCEPPYSACHCQLGGKGRVNMNARSICREVEWEELIYTGLVQPLRERVRPHPMTSSVSL